MSLLHTSVVHFSAHNRNCAEHDVSIGKYKSIYIYIDITKAIQSTVNLLLAQHVTPAHIKLCFTH